MTPMHVYISLPPTRIHDEYPQLTACGAGTSVASLLGLLVATLAQVVGAAVDDDGTLRKRRVSSGKLSLSWLSEQVSDIRQ